MSDRNLNLMDRWRPGLLLSHGALPCRVSFYGQDLLQAFLHSITTRNPNCWYMTGQNRAPETGARLATGCGHPPCLRDHVCVHLRHLHGARLILKESFPDSPGVLVVRNPLSSTGATGLLPGLASRFPCALGQLNQGNAAMEEVCTLNQRSCVPWLRPDAAKNKCINKSNKS